MPLVVTNRETETGQGKTVADNLKDTDASSLRYDLLKIRIRWAGSLHEGSARKMRACISFRVRRLTDFPPPRVTRRLSSRGLCRKACENNTSASTLMMARSQAVIDG